jgi:hypothetical protein
MVVAEVKGQRPNDESCGLAELAEGTIVSWEGSFREDPYDCTIAKGVSSTPPAFANSVVSSCTPYTPQFAMRCTGTCTMELEYSPQFTDDVPIEDAEVTITWTCGIEPPCVDRYTTRMELVPRAAGE